MELEKPYYTINEVAAMFNVNASLLRYWEKEFTQIKPYKNKKGDRRFTRQDIETIRTIYQQVYMYLGYAYEEGKEACVKFEVEKFARRFHYHASVAYLLGSDMLIMGRLTE